MDRQHNAPFALTPPSTDKYEVMALKALEQGVASEGQQKAILDWLVNKACQFNELSFDEVSDRVSAFAEGRRFVGLCIRAAISTTIQETEDAPKRRGPKPGKRIPAGGGFNTGNGDDAFPETGTG